MLTPSCHSTIDEDVQTKTSHPCKPVNGHFNYLPPLPHSSAGVSPKPPHLDKSFLPQSLGMDQQSTLLSNDRQSIDPNEEASAIGSYYYQHQQRAQSATPNHSQAALISAYQQSRQMELAAADQAQYQRLPLIGKQSLHHQTYPHDFQPPGSPRLVNHSTYFHHQPQPTRQLMPVEEDVELVEEFEKCPTICSMLTCLFCPLTLLCAFPALVLSLCSYADYRIRDLVGYQEKSDIARQLIITACIVGLLLTISMVVIGFFYYDVIFAFISDFVQLIDARVRSSSSSKVRHH